MMKKFSRYGKWVATVTLMVGAAMAQAADGQDHSGHGEGHAGHGAPATGEQAKVDAAKIYLEFCSVCHGDKGDGQSRARAGLVPPPKDFTQHQAAAELTRERMIQSVTGGIPGTAMSGWKARLSAEEIEAVVDYVRRTFMPAVTTEESDDGRRIFAEFCSVCHGDRGQGAVWARSGLKPPPANFTDPATQQELTRKRMIMSVTYGRAQTAMSAWGKRLSDEEIEAVVDYVRSSIMGVKDDAMAAADAGHDGHGAGGHDHDAHGIEAIMDPLPNGLVGDFARGKELYEQNCVACHGLKGDGQGPRAYFIFPKPRDFGHPEAQAKYSRDHLYRVIAKGELGTEMPAWDKVLDDQQIGDIAEYLFRSFIRPDSQG